MGAYKDANGKTRVGKALSSVGGFFKGIFSKKSTSSSTTGGTWTNVQTDTTPTTGGATPGINGNTSTNTGGSGGGWFSSVLIGVGLPALSEWLKSKGLGGTTNTGTTTTDNQNTGTDNTGTGGSMSSPNTGLVIGIILVILGIASFFIFRKKN